MKNKLRKLATQSIAKCLTTTYYSLVTIIMIVIIINNTNNNIPAWINCDFIMFAIYLYFIRRFVFHHYDFILFLFFFCDFYYKSLLFSLCVNTCLYAVLNVHYVFHVLIRYMFIRFSIIPL